MTLRNYLILLVIALHTSPIDRIMACFAHESFALLTFDELVRFRVQKSLPARIKGPKQRIQYVIHQTYEVDELPADMVMAIGTVQENNPDYAYRFYNGTDRREFIERHMGPTVLAAYDKIIPNAYKADLFRYSVVYTLGGCYFDIGFMFVRPLRDVLRSSDTFVSSKDGGDSTVSEINSAIFCAEAGHQILLLAIQGIVKMVAISDYGQASLDITGPMAFSRAFREYLSNSSMLLYPTYKEYGDGVRLFKQQSHYGCTAYPLMDTLGDGTPFMFSKYPRYGPDVTALLPGSRHYTSNWNSHEVYNESIVVPADGKFLKTSQ